MSDQSRRVPADRGLSGLGLIMQLFGSVFAAMGSAVGVIALIAFAQVNRYERSDSSIMVWILAIAGSSVTRSLILRQAGHELIYGTNPFQGIRRYFVAALVNTGIWLALLAGKVHAPSAMLVPMLMLLVAWPLALMVVISLPGIKEMSERVPPGEDKGFEGASILMLVFGLAWSVLMTLCLYVVWTATPSQMHSSGTFMLMVIAMIVLIIRSIIQVTSAMTGLRETRMDLVVGAVNRYADFGVIAAFVAGGALLIGVMTVAADVSALVGISCLVWALLAWPLTIRRFFGERQFADLMAGAEGAQPQHHRAPDLGLTTLGWLLAALALAQLAYDLPAALMTPSGAGMERGGFGDLGFLSALNPALGHSPWWVIGLFSLQLWAGIELIRMSDLHRIAATAFGAISAAVNLYFYWPLLSHLGSLGGRHGGMPGMDSTIMIASMMFALILPLVTLFVANRPAVPAATARFSGGNPPV